MNFADYKRILRLDGARVWSLGASLASRGSGFFATLVLARVGGSLAVGRYSLIVNTASFVIAPLLAAMSSKAIIAARSETGRGRLTLLAELGIGGAVALPCVLVFSFLYGQIADDGAGAPGALRHGTGFAVVAGQLLTSIVTGLYFGRGRFSAAGRICALLALVSTAIAVPMTLLFGLAGSLVAVIASNVGTVALLVRYYSTDFSADHATGNVRTALISSTRSLIAFAPSVLAAALGACANWLCSTFWVQTTYGATGVGTVAVATQWLTIMLIVPTSWGGITLKSLSDSARGSDWADVRRTTLALALRNGVASALVGLIVVASATHIGALYGMTRTGVATLIVAYAMVAVVFAVVNVLERLFVAVDRQRRWLVLSSVSFCAQIAVTFCLIDRTIVAVPVGGLAAGLVLLLGSTPTVLRRVRTSPSISLTVP